MKYDFDREIDRKGTHSSKWEFMPDENHQGMEESDECFGENRMLPMWVADMDFATAPAVVDALIERSKHGIFGYTHRTTEYDEAVVAWMKKRHGWDIDPAWICTTPGVVPALFMLVRTFAERGEKVLIQPPVYHPFYHAIEAGDRLVERNPLIYEDGRYHMDFADLEQKTRDPAVKLAILCHPHNPVGRVWTRSELTRFGEICGENDVLVISDEVHGDLIMPGIEFTAYGTLDDSLSQRAIICTAASKTFNLAGLKTSNIVIRDEELRSDFELVLERNAIYGLNPFGTAAVVAAYRHGDEWLEALRHYLAANLRTVEDFVARNLPQIRVVPLEGTYLVWLDCRELGIHAHELDRFMRKKARIILDDGCLFGTEGEGFQRMNIACPRPILVDALNRMKSAIEAMPALAEAR